MSDYLPIVVAAPANARERLHRLDVLPQNLLRDISDVQLWEPHSAPAIYMWPFDIPYSHSDELRKIAGERVADLPAFFGMDTKEPNKDHQERVLSWVLSGSVVVHILYLDNKKTDTTPTEDERSETYAQFCTFGEIIQWSRDLKYVMDVRFPNNRFRSQHILVLVSPKEPVVATRKEIAELNELIGKNKPFCSCYFINEHLEPGPSGPIIHSDYMWDVLVGRFLLALLLSQEKADYPNAQSPLWEDKPGIKLWRAWDCLISVPQQSSQVVLKRTMEKAANKLQSLVSTDKEKDLMLLRDLPEDRNSLDYELKACWNEKAKPNFDKWPDMHEASWFNALWFKSFFRNWSDLRVSEYEKQIESPNHWEGSFEELCKERLSWSKNHPPKDFTSFVKNFFGAVSEYPRELGSFIAQLSDKMKKTYDDLQKKSHSDNWTEIVAAETRRCQLVKQLAEDSKEFKKAQDHYIGYIIALLVMMSVTAFFGWIIWQVLSLFNVGLLRILLLSGMVFCGSLTACVLVMFLHNYAGILALGKIMAECRDVEQKMKDRDELVRNMFFDGVRQRDVLMLQCVRFRTWLLAKRVQSFLIKELQPPLSSLLDAKEDDDLRLKRSDASDPDHVRDAYLILTRSTIGPLVFTDIDAELWNELENEYLSGKGEKSFCKLWEQLCSEDLERSGYFPAKMFVSRIRCFVNEFLGEVHRRVVKKSITAETHHSDIEAALTKFSEDVDAWVGNESLLSAPLSEDSHCNGMQNKILFINSSFEEFSDKLSIDECENYISKLLKNTRTAALFYKEFNVEFDLQLRPDSEDTDPGDLTFKVIEEH